MNDSGPQVLVWPRRRAAETAPQDVLALCELRAAPVRSEWAEAPQSGQGDGRKVVRKRGFDEENVYIKVLRWN